MLWNENALIAGRHCRPNDAVKPVIVWTVRALHPLFNRAITTGNRLSILGTKVVKQQPMLARLVTKERQRLGSTNRRQHPLGRERLP